MSDLKDEVHAIVDQLSHDELRVLRMMGRRMIDIGHAKYGALDLSQHQRNWNREKAQETSDRLFYEQCVELAREDSKAERLRCFKADEAYAKVNDAANEFALAVGTPELQVCADCLATDGRHGAGCPMQVLR